MLRGTSRSGIQSKVLALTIFCLGAPSAFAVHDDSAIEMDGDVVSSVFDDWEDVYNDCGTSGPCPPVTTGASRQSFQSDSGLPDATSFTGSKDADPVNSTVGGASWQCTEGQVQGKSDIEYAYGAVYDELGEKILYAGMDRRSFNGTSYMGIWLFQQPVGCVSTGGATPFTGHKTDGDLLLIINYTNGGAVNSVNVYRWTDPDFSVENGDECLGGPRGPIGSECVNEDQLYFSSVDCENPTISDPPINDSLCGITNGATPISPSWRPDSPLGDNAFFEAGINLTDFSLTDAVSGSECYSSIMIETRSSAELTADLKDFVFLDLATCGTVTIGKATDPAVGDNFNFSVSPAAGADATASFVLADGQTITLDAVENGVYTFTEDLLTLPSEDWSLVDITCNEGVVSTDLNTGALVLNVTTEEDVVCTFFNELAPPPGTLLISKSCDTTSGNTDTWDFDLTGPEGSLLGSTTPECATGTVSLGCNQSVSCEGLLPGEHTVTEVDPAQTPWFLSNIECAGGDSTTCDVNNSNTATLVLGDQEGVTDFVSAKFTNTEEATITITKKTVPTGLTDVFSFTGDLGAFNLTDGVTAPFANLTPGQTYSVTEQPAAGFTITGFTCSGSNWAGIGAGDTVNITPAAGETVACTVTNTRNPGTITVCKETVPADASTAFTFELAGAAAGLPVSATLVDKECSLPTVVPVGNGYSITEAPQVGWDLTSATCDDGSPVDNIDVSADEAVTCTFVNTQRGSITVIKNTVGGDDTFSFTATGTGYNNFSITTVGNSGQSVASNLLPGPYGVTEDGPPIGWAYDGVTCDDDDGGNDSTALVLDAGENITCTFTNTKLIPAISIEKTPDTQSVAPGGTAVWTITVTNTGELALDAVTVTDALAPLCDKVIGALAIGASASYSCSLDNVQAAFTNVADVTGNPVDGGAPVEDSDSADVSLLGPSISIVKSPATQAVSPGAPANWTIEVTNTGNVDLESVVVSDALAPNCDKAVGALAIGASDTYACSLANIQAPFTNVADVTGNPVGGGDPVTDTDSAAVTLLDPEISIEKSPDPQSVAPGATADWTITVTNTGNVDLESVVVSDALAPNCDKAVGALAIGASDTYACSLANIQAPFTNVADVTGNPVGGGDPVTDTDSAAVTLLDPEISIEKSPDPQSVAPGATADWTITVTNTGNVDLESVVVSDALAPNCDKAVGALAIGASDTYACSLADIRAPFTNVADVTGNPVGGGDPVEDSDDADVTLLTPSILIVKSPNNQAVSPGGTAEWTITVTNTGDIALTDVDVTDVLAPNCNSAIGDLGIGESASYQCTLDGIETPFTNVADAIGTPEDGGDPVSDSDTARVQIYIPPEIIPVDNAWALMLLILSIAGVAWYRRPLGD